MSLDERYGRRPSRNGRRGLAVALVAFVLVALGWGVWAVRGAADARITRRDVAVDISDSSAVRVSFAVTLAPGRPAVCAVQATDAAGAVVGRLDVPVPASPTGRATATATVRTSEPATGGGVSSCIRR